MSARENAPVATVLKPGAAGDPEATGDAPVESDRMDSLTREADREPPRFMSVRQVSRYLHLNEKKVYALVSEGKIPATKVTGKWLFPRALVDQWVLESSHGGVLTDRLLINGSDDPLLARAISSLAIELRAHALISYTCTGTELGLSLLAKHRADICAMHWGPADESRRRHPALIRQYPQHHDWVLVRAFLREQGLMVSPDYPQTGLDLRELFAREARWAMRQEGAGSQRFLQEILADHGIDGSTLHVTTRAGSEREAASLIAMGHADVAPGVRGAATEFGLEFQPIGWEAYDLALYRGVYFRTLFQKLLDYLRGPEGQHLAKLLGGYNLSETGLLIWSE
jgi:putative molybdopterin biosynthesis protein